jgi:uncharacterized RDD family membrane protein YckC
MEQTPGSNKAGTPSEPKPADVIAVTPSGEARPIAAPAPATPPAPIPVRPVAASPTPRPYKPIIIPDDEPAGFDHGHGNPLVLLVRRGLAFLVDTVGIGIVLAAFGYQAMTAGKLPLSSDEQGFLELLALALGGALLFLFLFEAVTGTSVGKLLFGLHVRRVGGQRAGLGAIFWRNIFRILDILVIGVILILFLRHRQRVGDKVSDTTVGRSPIGPFAPVTGLLIIGALVWAVAEHGGGATTLQALQTRAQTYAPEIYQRAVSLLTGQPNAQAPVQSAPQPSAQPSSPAQPSAAPSVS